MIVNPPTTSRLGSVLFASLFAVLIALTSVSAMMATSEEVQARPTVGAAEGCDRPGTGRAL
ncbi:MAG: hypothetical protein JWP80_3087 [Pseudomonas sp.]|nr:hypothetical protein [Pseudomonas sp.]